MTTPEAKPIDAEAADELDAARRQIATLQAIVEKLPLTRDGVRVTPGMELWCVMDRQGEAATGMSWSALVDNADDMDLLEEPTKFDHLYSTREGALAAAEMARNRMTTSEGASDE